MIFSFLFLFWQVEFNHLPVWQNWSYLSAAAVRADSLYPVGEYALTCPEVMPYSANARSNAPCQFSNGIYQSQTRPRAPVKVDPISLGPEISAASAIAVDKKSGAVLYSKNENKVLPLASLTKLLSALVFLDLGADFEKIETMLPSDQRPGAADILRPGESASLLSFLRASLQASANNATLALARALAGDEQTFVGLMNRKAEAIGMASSNFIEPTGLASENKGTAYDIARLLSGASRFAIIQEITSQPKSTIKVWRCPSRFGEPAACEAGQVFAENRAIINTDQLIYSFVKVIMGKTGYLDESLYNLASEVELKNGSRLFLVTLGSATSEARWQDQKSLAAWVEKTYRWEE